MHLRRCVVTADDFSAVVRTCTVDSGGTNSESELGRESHCWMVNQVNFNNKTMNGCSVACDTDGCNTGAALVSSNNRLIVLIFLAFSSSVFAREHILLW